MSNKWTIGIMVIFVVLTVMSGICEYTVFGDDDTSLLQRLMTTPDISETTSIVGAVFGYIGFGWDYLQTLWDVLWFDYSFFQGQWLLVKYILFYPVSIAFVISIILAIRGVGSN